ncbi:hypothetical protein CONPUDRAFT_170350 [Coniophora puteana RWD-64-598 SS2]|uniref:Transmembrane protein n=1 Tax=Coniophora puteana (strain RWD-64-598) TaxID=741705 RepID=R7SDW9_CONPW|nr:uncharacterized protein CONPUDRAFT_170350 [Coniophora puteana RWD-64-598 SS2]EIW74065.1 hypothetical protein CONPUDRAFT_170350 [Coniophora puteana RWD-64-598 SS2]
MSICRSEEDEQAVTVTDIGPCHALATECHHAHVILFCPESHFARSSSSCLRVFAFCPFATYARRPPPYPSTLRRATRQKRLLLMLLTILTSVAFLALRVTGRPVPEDIYAQDSENSGFAPISPRGVAQAAFQLLREGSFEAGHPSHSDNLQDSQKTFADHVDAAIVDAPTSGAIEKHVFPTDSSVSPEFIKETSASSDAGAIPEHALEPTEANQGGALPTPALLFVLTLSSVAAFLALACVSAVFYTIKIVRSRVYASRNFWEVLQRSSQHAQSSARRPLSADCMSEHVYDDKCAPLILIATEVEQSVLVSRPSPLIALDDDEPPLISFDEVVIRLPVNADSDSDSDSDYFSDAEDAEDFDHEKFHDALDSTPAIPPRDLPPIVAEDVPPPTALLQLPIPSRVHTLSPLPCEMRELASPAPVTRPSWSNRAADAPTLGLISQPRASASVRPSLPKAPALVHPRRRAYRHAMPELDFALAMQLRPGLGLGADPAWMVRFLMTMFGWFAVALTSSR